MIEKHLTEADWKKFSKDRGYKDAALLKALGALAKSDKAGPRDQLKALDAIEEQFDALAKVRKGDKEFTAYLPFVQAALKKQRKAAQDAAEAAEDAAADEDEPASALLDPKKLLAQLNLCKKNPDRTVQFAFVDGHDKKPAVFTLHPKLNGRKMFAKLQEETGVKTGAFGSAWIDGTSLMLQLDKPLAGLVKKVRAPVKAAGFRVARVVLWNDDGTVFEQDDEDAGETAGPASSGKTSDELRQAFEVRMAELQPQLLNALKEQRGDGSKLRTVADFAREKGIGGQYQAALQALDALEELLQAAAGSPGEASAIIPEGKVAAMRQTLSRARDRWDTALATTKSSIKPFQALLEKQFPDEAAGIGDILDSYWQDLTDAIAAGQAQEKSGDVEGAVSGTLATINGLRTEILEDALLTYLGENGVPVRPAFIEAFKDVEEMLRG